MVCLCTKMSSAQVAPGSWGTSVRVTSLVIMITDQDVENNKGCSWENTAVH